VDRKRHAQTQLCQTAKQWALRNLPCWLCVAHTNSSLQAPRAGRLDVADIVDTWSLRQRTVGSEIEAERKDWRLLEDVLLSAHNCFSRKFNFSSFRTEDLRQSCD
jgi:hypothetical protein